MKTYAGGGAVGEKVLPDIDFRRGRQGASQKFPKRHAAPVCFV
jgi:hypothetical protein